MIWNQAGLRQQNFRPARKPLGPVGEKKLGQDRACKLCGFHEHAKWCRDGSEAFRLLLRHLPDGYELRELESNAGFQMSRREGTCVIASNITWGEGAGALARESDRLNGITERPTVGRWVETAEEVIARHKQRLDDGFVTGAERPGWRVCECGKHAECYRFEGEGSMAEAAYRDGDQWFAGAPGSEEQVESLLEAQIAVEIPAWERSKEQSKRAPEPPPVEPLQ